MITREDLEAYLGALLNVPNIKDYCPNGLQVEGRHSITKIVGGVTASQALIDKAIALGADAVLVHHGYFWRGEREPITGMKKRRLQALLTHDLNLFAYHLPLDVHAQFGNNMQLAKVLGFECEGSLEPGNSNAVGLAGVLASTMQAGALRDHISERLGRECLMIGDPEATVRTIAWCTGAAQGMIEQAISLSVDAYLSGEISEPTVHMARETGIVYFSAGHHATERYGVLALGEHLRERFKIDFEFVDIDNPV